MTEQSSSGFQWTPSQWRAICALNGHILLTAAAGSGKTAVLAQRCARLLAGSDRADSPSEPGTGVDRRAVADHAVVADPAVGSDPVVGTGDSVGEECCCCDGSELLVLTFTRDSAAEMRRRIRQRLKERVQQQPSRRDLRRQLLLIDHAPIGTVHAFCTTLLRDHYYELGLDPLFEVLDQADADLLRVQVAEEVLESSYQQSPEAPLAGAFEGFVENYSGRGDDRSLIELMLQLPRFLETLADASRWRDAVNGQLLNAGEKSLDELAVVQRHREHLVNGLEQLLAQLETTRQWFAEQQDSASCQRYLDYLVETIIPQYQQLKQLLVSGAVGDVLAGEAPIDFGRRPTNPKGTPQEDKDAIETAHDRLKKATKDFLTRFWVTPEAVLAHLRHTEPYVHVLLELNNRFTCRYAELKQRMGVLDFSDLEHRTLELLGGQGGASAVAEQLAGHYRYILVDEYQDISPIQEAILQRLAGAGREQSGGGNLFMVGDVCQSIYGFRQADPTIFLGKYRDFTADDSSGDPTAGTTSGTTAGTRAGTTAGRRAGATAGTPAAATGDPVDGSAGNVFGNAEDGARENGSDGPGDDVAAGGGEVIDLDTNFRSRRVIIDTVNHLFARCMTPTLGGIDYEQQGRLAYGGDDDPVEDPPVELVLIDKPGRGSDGDGDNASDDDADSIAVSDSSVYGEAVTMAARIRRMIDSAETVRDRETGQLRPVLYRDITVLLRSMRHRAEQWVEVFRQEGIPVHADLRSGYFEAIEIRDMLSLLRVLDNSQQDIPLASVLRGPLVGLSASSLASIRQQAPGCPFHRAVYQYALDGPDLMLRERLGVFLQRLDRWRDMVCRQPLSELIWRVYTETHLLAFVRAQPAGRQRYRNLLHLYDRSRQFESFSRQGLGRFLRFIDKLQAEQGDFGPPPILSEADNVVRITSIHASKGLEFPVVILAGLGRRFNLRGTHERVLFDRPDRTPLGLRVVDANSGQSWSTVPNSLIRDQQRLTQLAEEMRILYVAMTRARDRLIMTATVGIDRARRAWGQWRFWRHGALPTGALVSASGPMDWVGPALASHPDMAEALFADAELEAGDESPLHPLDTIRPGQQLCPIIVRRPQELAVGRTVSVQHRRGELSALLLGRGSSNGSSSSGVSTPGPDSPASTPLPPQSSLSASPTASSLPGEPMAEDADLAESLLQRVSWSYSHQWACGQPARCSVSELKGMAARSPDSEETLIPPLQQLAGTSPGTGFDRCPASLVDDDGGTGPDPRVRGTRVHDFLQWIDLEGALDQADLERERERLVERGVFTPEGAADINLAWIGDFLHSPLGRQMIDHRDSLRREWPFTLLIPAAGINARSGDGSPQRPATGSESIPATGDVADSQARASDDRVLVRGMIDAFYETAEGVVVVDYKTDAVTDETLEARVRAYQPQMEWYAVAVTAILNKPVVGALLYFFSLGRAVEVALEGYEC